MEALAIVIMWISEGTKIREKQRCYKLKTFCIRHKMLAMIKKLCHRVIVDDVFHQELNHWYEEYILDNIMEIYNPIWNYDDGFVD